MGQSVFTDYRAYEEGNPFMAYNHIEIVDADVNKTVVKVDLRHESKNLYGSAHGALMYGMVDCAAGITARSGGEAFVTLNSNINFLRNVSEGEIIASTEVIKRGRKVLFLHAEVRSESGKLLMDGSVSMMKTE